MTETMTKIKSDIAQILELMDDLAKNIDTHKNIDHTLQRELADKVKDLYHITVGLDGRNGLRSRVESLERRHENVDPQDIKKQLDNQVKWRYQTMAILAVVQIILVPVIIAIILRFIP